MSDLQRSLQNGAQPGSAFRNQGGDRRWAPPGHTAGEYPNLSMYYLPIPCMHCSDPPCLPSCPTEAIYQRQDGIVLIDDESCNGCQECLHACPYNVLVYDSGKGKVWKCTLCAHRVDQRLEPFCVLCCEMEAIFFGDISDPSTQVSQLADQRKAYVLRPETRDKASSQLLPAQISSQIAHAVRFSLTSRRVSIHRGLSERFPITQSTSYGREPFCQFGKSRHVFQNEVLLKRGCRKA